MNVGGNDADGTYDSVEYPEVLEFAPETIWTVSDGEIIAYQSAAKEGPAEETAGEDEEDGPPDPDDIDFYDEEHEDGEEFDPNDYTRLFK